MFDASAFLVGIDQAELLERDGAGQQVCADGQVGARGQPVTSSVSFGVEKRGVILRENPA